MTTTKSKLKDCRSPRKQAGKTEREKEREKERSKMISDPRMPINDPLSHLAFVVLDEMAAHNLKARLLFAPLPNDDLCILYDDFVYQLSRLLSLGFSGGNFSSKAVM